MPSINPYDAPRVAGKTTPTVNEKQTQSPNRLVTASAGMLTGALVAGFSYVSLVGLVDGGQLATVFGAVLGAISGAVSARYGIVTACYIAGIVGLLSALAVIGLIIYAFTHMQPVTR